MASAPLRRSGAKSTPGPRGRVDRKSPLTRVPSVGASWPFATLGFSLSCALLCRGGVLHDA